MHTAYFRSFRRRSFKEAARAGEAGKGFAVVAEEARNLASKSADAAKDTTELIEQSMEAVNEGMSKASATSAEQLSSQATMLKELIKTFKLSVQQHSEYVHRRHEIKRGAC